MHKRKKKEKTAAFIKNITHVQMEFDLNKCSYLMLNLIVNESFAPNSQYIYCFIEGMLQTSWPS